MMYMEVERRRIRMVTMKVAVAAQTFPYLKILSSFPPHHPRPASFSLKSRLKNPSTIKSHQSLSPGTQINTPDQPNSHHNPIHEDDDDNWISIENVKTLVKFKSRYNYIRVLEISRKADHSLAGCRLLLLDGPGNIHSISHVFNSLTNAYFDVFATIPPLIPPEGPIGILGFGAGSAGRILLEMYPHVVVQGWEIDPSVISVGRKYFGLEKVEKEHENRLFVYIGNALNASVRGGFSGILIDLFRKGRVVPELQDPRTWVKLKECLREGGRIMVNVGGSCVEAEDYKSDGKVIMEETLEAMNQVFPDKVHVFSLENRKDDSSIALTGVLPNLDDWRMALPRPLKHYVHGWKPYGKKNMRL